MPSRIWGFFYGPCVRNRKFDAYENPIYRSRESTY